MRSNINAAARRFRYHELDWYFGLILRMAISWPAGDMISTKGKSVAVSVTRGDW